MSIKSLSNLIIKSVKEMKSKLTQKEMLGQQLLYALRKQSYYYPNCTFSNFTIDMNLDDVYIEWSDDELCDCLEFNLSKEEAIKYYIRYFVILGAQWFEENRSAKISFDEIENKVNEFYNSGKFKLLSYKEGTPANNMRKVLKHINNALSCLSEDDIDYVDYFCVFNKITVSDRSRDYIINNRIFSDDLSHIKNIISKIKNTLKKQGYSSKVESFIKDVELYVKSFRKMKIK